MGYALEPLGAFKVRGGGRGGDRKFTFLCILVLKEN